MRKTLLALLALAVACAAAFYFLTMPPATVQASALPAHTPDLANGKYVFTAAGCAECHAAPVKGCDDLKTKDKETLAGGRCLKTPYGIFHVPNISPDKQTGIGGWTTVDFVNAMKHGVAPDGSPDPSTVRKLSVTPQNASACNPVACTEGRVGFPCSGPSDHVACDSFPGAANGVAD